MLLQILIGQLLHSFLLPLPLILGGFVFVKVEVEEIGSSAKAVHSGVRFGLIATWLLIRGRWGGVGWRNRSRSGGFRKAGADGCLVGTDLGKDTLLLLLDRLQFGHPLLDRVGT